MPKRQVTGVVTSDKMKKSAPRGNRTAGAAQASTASSCVARPCATYTTRTTNRTMATRSRSSNAPPRSKLKRWDLVRIVERVAAGGHRSHASRRRHQARRNRRKEVRCNREPSATVASYKAESLGVTMIQMQTQIERRRQHRCQGSDVHQGVGRQPPSHGRPGRHHRLQRQEHDAGSEVKKKASFAA